MKIKSLLVAMLAIVSFASCSQNDDETQDLSNKSSNLIVKFGDAVDTRSIDGPVNSGENYTLNNVTVFLLQSDVVTNMHALTQAELDKKECVFEKVNATTVNNVLVVANIPEKDLTKVVNIKSAKAIQNYPFTVESQASADANPGVKHVTLMGQNGTFVSGTKIDEHDYMTVAVKLSALVARIEVGTVKAGEGINNISLNAIFVNNYFKDGSKKETVLNTSGSEYWKDAAFSSYSEMAYMDKFNAAVNGDGTKCYAYQVFAGNLPHILLCVSGKLNDDREFTNQWVTFRKYKLGADYITAMEANKIYNLGKEVTVNEGDLTPFPEMGDIDLGVTITVKDWEVQDVTPEV